MTASTSQRDHTAPICSKCGCTHPGGSGFHFHHAAPATPGDGEYELWESIRDELDAELRMFGPDDLLDMACIRHDADVDTRPLDRRIQSRQVGDLVKLCFLIKDREGRWLPPEIRHMTQQCESEAMLVKITSITGDWPSVTYQGTLLNMPLFINPSELQLGCNVHFTPDHIHSA